MKKPIAVNKEAPFKINELFFSTTDLKGLIEFGNGIFVRVSGYDKSDLIGAPHNIIRHPDMPKCVFKIFWDTLKNNAPICAYVKNMSADGSYYWVFASAFPVNNEYLSIRFKPSSDLFKIVQDLYADVLKKEKSSSMEEAEKYLLIKLQELGFASYTEFMVHAAVQELSSFEQNNTDTHINTESNDPDIKKITAVRLVTAEELTKSFHKIGDFGQCSDILIQRITYLSTEFKKLSMLSLNMNILAAKFGEEAATLSVISDQFAKIASQIETELNAFSQFAQGVKQEIVNCSLNISTLKIQMNMVDFFLKESLGNNNQEALEEIALNRDIFTQVFELTVNKLLNVMNKLNKDIRKLQKLMDTLKTSLNGMEIIKQIAAMESSRDDKVRVGFNTYIDEMNNFLKLLKTTFDELSKEQKKLHQHSTEIVSSTDGIKDNIKTIFELAVKSSQRSLKSVS